MLKIGFINRLFMTLKVFQFQKSLIIDFVVHILFGKYTQMIITFASFETYFLKDLQNYIGSSLFSVYTVKNNCHQY